VAQLKRSRACTRAIAELSKVTHKSGTTEGLHAYLIAAEKHRATLLAEKGRTWWRKASFDAWQVKKKVLDASGAWCAAAPSRTAPTASRPSSSSAT